MHPVLLNFRLGGTEVVLESYSTFYVLACVVALALGTVIAGKRGLRWPRALLAYGGALVIGIAGARLLDVAADWGVYAHDPAQIYAFQFHGLSLYGGLILGLAAGASLARALRVSRWRLADSAVPGLVAGIVLMRTGCFLQGCCFGKVTSLPWAVTFPMGSPAWSWQLATGKRGVLSLAGLVLPVHPTQIYEMIAALVFGGISVWLVPQRLPAARRAAGPGASVRPERVAAGVPFLAFLLGFTLFRVAEYYLRARSLAATEPSWFYPLLYGVIIAAATALLTWRVISERERPKPVA